MTRGVEVCEKRLDLDVEQGALLGESIHVRALFGGEECVAMSRAQERGNLLGVSVETDAQASSGCVPVVLVHGGVPFK